MCTVDQISANAPEPKEDKEESVVDTRTPPAPPAHYEDKVLCYLVVGVMPFLYGGATRLPFIYFVIHLAVHFELNWWVIGLCVGAYQSGRVMINIACIYAPRTAHFLGTAIGFAGYLTVYVCDKDLAAPFIAGTAVIGFSETMACMQKHAKELFKLDPDRKKTQRMLKYQYVSVMCGVMFAFSIGGVLYQHYAINGVAVFGMFVEGIGLLSLLWYLVVMSLRPQPEVPAGFKFPEELQADAIKEGANEGPVRRPTDLTRGGITTIEFSGSSDTSPREHQTEEVEHVIEFYPSDESYGKEEDDADDASEEYDIEMGNTDMEGRKPLFSEEILEALSVDSLSIGRSKTSDNNSAEEIKEEEGEVVVVEEEISFDTGLTPPTNEEASAPKETVVSAGVYREGFDALDGSDVEEIDLDVKSCSSNDIEEGALQDSQAQRKQVAEQNMNTIVNLANANYHTLDIPATWLNWLVCVSFGIEALTIGYNLSIGPIFIMEQFHTNTGIIGVLFAIGAGLGSIFSIAVTCTDTGKAILRRIAESPYDLCFAMGGIGLGVFVAGVPIFGVHICGLIVLMAFNDLGATLLTEFQGSITTVSTYSTLGPLGQVIRRSLNVVTAVSGPVLYGLYPSLPHMVAGTITLGWTILLVIAFKIRSRATLQRLASATGRSNDSLRSILSFQTMEVVRSVSKEMSRHSREFSKHSRAFSSGMSSGYSSISSAFSFSDDESDIVAEA